MAFAANAWMPKDVPRRMRCGSTSDTAGFWVRGLREHGGGASEPGALR